MLIAQISDTHIMPKGELLYGRLDSSMNLGLAVRQLFQLDTMPDCLLLTGDLTDRGQPAAYDHLREILKPLPMPIYAIPGNHDRRESMRAAFSSDRATTTTSERDTRGCCQGSRGCRTTP